MINFLSGHFLYSGIMWANVRELKEEGRSNGVPNCANGFIKFLRKISYFGRRYLVTPLDNVLRLPNCYAANACCYVKKAEWKFEKIDFSKQIWTNTSNTWNIYNEAIENIHNW